MWWSFDQWVIVMGLVIAGLGATAPVSIEVVRRHRVRVDPEQHEVEVVEIEEQFLNHLTEELQSKDLEILELKKDLARVRSERAEVYRQRDQAFLLLARAGIPIPE